MVRKSTTILSILKNFETSYGTKIENCFISDGTVTMSAESGDCLLDYYGEFANTQMYVNGEFEAYLEKNKLHLEWYDAGTVQIYCNK